MIQSIISKFIRLGRGRFTITRKWFRQFMKHHMCWIYYVTTIIANKFQQINLFKVAPWLIGLLIWWRHIPFHQHLLRIMIKLESILSLLMVEEPRKQRVPNMQMLNLENKRQITIMVSSSVVLPPQFLFISTTFITLPLDNQGKTNYIKDG